MIVDISRSKVYINASSKDPEGRPLIEVKKWDQPDEAIATLRFADQQEFRDFAMEMQNAVIFFKEKLAVKTSL